MRNDSSRVCPPRPELQTTESNVYPPSFDHCMHMPTLAPFATKTNGKPSMLEPACWLPPPPTAWSGGGGRIQQAGSNMLPSRNDEEGGSRGRPPPLTLFHRRSPANMKPLLVTKSDPTMLIAVARLPENTSPDICETDKMKQHRHTLNSLLMRSKVVLLQCRRCFSPSRAEKVIVLGRARLRRIAHGPLNPPLPPPRRWCTCKNTSTRTNPCSPSHQRDYPRGEPPDERLDEGSRGRLPVHQRRPHLLRRGRSVGGFRQRRRHHRRRHRPVAAATTASAALRKNKPK